MTRQYIDIEAHFRTYEELKRTSATLADGVSEAREGIHRREQYRTVLNAARRLDLCARVFAGYRMYCYSLVTNMQSIFPVSPDNAHHHLTACGLTSQVLLSRPVVTTPSRRHLFVSLRFPCAVQAREGPGHGHGVPA